MDTNIEVPPFFVCPISLEIMKDPVIISTGITYDRTSIEKWLFSGKNDTCPVTKQVISGTDLTPNVMLRRLIQSWCTVHASQGIERCPTPKTPVSQSQLLKLFNEAHQVPQMASKCLQRLRSLASYNETNKRVMETAGAAEFLVSIVNKATTDELLLCKTDQTYYNNTFDQLKNAGEEALSLLYNLHLSDSGLKTLVRNNNGMFMESLVRIMQRGTNESRVYAVLLMKSMSDVADPTQLITIFRPNFFMELVELLREQVCPKATKATLKLLTRVCPFGRNRIKAVEAGAVAILIELLLDSTDKRCSEMMLVVLELLCQSADGRAELLNHGAGLAMVSKKILRVSQVASERCVKILYSISKFSATTSVLQDFLSLEVVSKLFLVLQVESGSKMKERAREILKKNASAWKNSPCIPTSLIPTFPC